MNVIEVKGLKKTYKNGVKAINNIDFEVKKGEVFAFLGPNGAGKTTTVEILEGLRQKTNGEIWFFGKKIEKIDSSIKEKIGVVLQQTKLMELLTVKETIRLFCSFFNKSIEYKKIIDLINLREKENAKVKTLSGGQHQRLAIGLALVNDPEIIFLDEPTTGLDPQARRNVWKLINDLKKEGKTIFLTTHYMEEAQDLSDEVCIIDHGKIIIRGKVDELINSVSEDSSIIKFSIDGGLKDASKIPFKLTIRKESYVLKTTNVVNDLSKLMQWAKNNEILLKDIDIRNPNLEDLFIQLTGKELRD